MPESSSFLGYIISASPVVKLVLLVLMALSIASWTYIFQRIVYFRKVRQAMDAFEAEFSESQNLQQLYQSAQLSPRFEVGSEQLFMAGFAEFKRISQLTGKADKIIDNTERAMFINSNEQTPMLERHLSFLATVGSISPYIGLFGTVWGIMMAFHSLSAASQVSIAMVAPGIAEALIATAIGLFAAIPAVMAYNRFSFDVNGFVSRMDNFQERFSLMLSRVLMKETEEVEL